MQAHNVLPNGYESKYTFDFMKPGWAIGLNIATLPVTLLFGMGFVFLANTLRAVDIIEAFNMWAGSITTLLLSIILIFVMLILHELVHGFGFWWFTRARPKFGGTLFAAYAGAPGWYIPAHQHFVIGITPLVVLTLLGFVLLLIVPPAWIMPVVFLSALQGGGALGDMLVCGFEIVQPKSVLVEDTGLKITVYGRE